MKIKNCIEGDCENGALITQLCAALKPFAGYADPRGGIPRSFLITHGSPLAKKQLTMGDCYDAKKILDSLK